jgi:hypothetical protein
MMELGAWMSCLCHMSWAENVFLLNTFLMNAFLLPAAPVSSAFWPLFITGHVQEGMFKSRFATTHERMPTHVSLWVTSSGSTPAAEVPHKRTRQRREGGRGVKAQEKKEEVGCAHTWGSRMHMLAAARGAL